MLLLLRFILFHSLTNYSFRRNVCSFCPSINLFILRRDEKPQELMSFGTSVPYHPLNAWGSMPNGGGRNGFTHGRHQGVFLYDMGALSSGTHSGSFFDFDESSPPPPSKTASASVSGSTGGGSESYGLKVASNEIREVVGRFVTVTFEIVDKRPMDVAAAEKYRNAKAQKEAAGGEEGRGEGELSEEEKYEREMLGERNKRKLGERVYYVTLSLGSNALDPLVAASFDAPGVYTLEFELPRPMLATVVRSRKEVSSPYSVLSLLHQKKKRKKRHVSLFARSLHRFFSFHLSNPSICFVVCLFCFVCFVLFAAKFMIDESPQPYDAGAARGERPRAVVDRAVLHQLQPALLRHAQVGRHAAAAPRRAAHPPDRRQAGAQPERAAVVREIRGGTGGEWG